MGDVASLLEAGEKVARAAVIVALLALLWAAERAYRRRCREGDRAAIALTACWAVCVVLILGSEPLVGLGLERLELIPPELRRVLWQYARDLTVGVGVAMCLAWLRLHRRLLHGRRRS